MNDCEYDFLVIGAGIVGLATAYRLLTERPGSRLAVVDKEAAVAQHQTGRNSGVLHSGVYYRPGSLKAQYCLKGYRMMVDFCRLHGIAHELCGKVIVAINEGEVGALDRLLENGRKNGLEGLRILDERELREREPHIRGLRALLVPQAGIVDYGAVARELQRLTEAGGGSFFFNRQVTAIEGTPGNMTVMAGERKITARQVVTCGGLHADRLAALTGSDVNCRIVPFRGEYYRLKEGRQHLVKHLVYPVPDPAFPFLGVHFTRRISGEVDAGPNAVLAFAREGYRLGTVRGGDLWETLTYRGFRKLASRHFGKGMEEMKRSVFKAAFVAELQKMLPEITAADLEAAPAGVRAQALAPDGSLVEDFVFDSRPGVLHVINAPSPAATASLAIATHIVDNIFGSSNTQC